MYKTDLEHNSLNGVCYELQTSPHYPLQRPAKSVNKLLQKLTNVALHKLSMEDVISKKMQWIV